MSPELTSRATSNADDDDNLGRESLSIGTEDAVRAREVSKPPPRHVLRLCKTMIKLPR